MLRYFLRDLFSDIAGAIGIRLSVIPILGGITDFIQMIASIGGVILLYFSIKYKIELIKEKKIQNRSARQVKTALENDESGVPKQDPASGG